MFKFEPATLELVKSVVEFYNFNVKFESILGIKHILYQNNSFPLYLKR